MNTDEIERHRRVWSICSAQRRSAHEQQVIGALRQAGYEVTSTKRFARYIQVAGTPPAA